MTENQVTIFGCPDPECPWTYEMPYGSDVVPTPEVHNAAWSEHLTTVHGLATFD